MALFTKGEEITKTKGEEITKEDILYQDSDVCILKPHVKKGILIWHRYQNPSSNGIDIPAVGLKSGAQLKKEGVDTGRCNHHSCIFFRAPHIKASNIDYTSFATEVRSSYYSFVAEEKNLMFIRVDPAQTNVYASEIRVSSYPETINQSKKTMLKYLDVIDQNKKTWDSPWDRNKMTPLWHLYDGLMILAKKNLFFTADKFWQPFVEWPTNMHSEVFVTTPHIPPEFFVHQN